MEEFDPIESQFDPTVDPLTADQQGLAILSKLEEGENLRGDFDEKFNLQIADAQAKLRTNLGLYQKYKKSRGERLFSYEQEVTARQEAIDDVTLAYNASSLLQADEETFSSLLEENGDTENYRIGQSFATDQKGFRAEYSVRELLKRSGYSEREIDAGAAESHMRQRLNAGEHEPTRDAYLRWSLSKINENNRRHDIATSAAK